MTYSDRLGDRYTGLGAHGLNSPPPFFLKGGGGGGAGVNSNYHLQREGTLKNFKKEWKYGAGAGLFKRGGLAIFLFNFFKVYHFYT